MKHILVSSLFALLAPAVALAQPADKAKPAPVAKGEPAPPPPEVAQTVKAFEGNWTFDAKITMPGDTEPTKAKVKLACKKIAAGNGISCTGTAKVPKLGPWDASFLIGFDPAGKRTHVMAITNMGEVHDHQCTWADTKLNCDPLKFGTATEALNFEWKDAKNASFRSETKDKGGTILFEGVGKRPKAPK